MFSFPSLHFDVISVALRIQKIVQEWRYKEVLEGRITAKIPFSPYILASQPVSNTLSTLKASYMLDILICWLFFLPSFLPRISLSLSSSPSLSVLSIMQVPKFYWRLQLDQMFGWGKEAPSRLPHEQLDRSAPCCSCCSMLTPQSCWSLEHSLLEIPSATPLPSAGLHHLEDQTGTRVRGLAKAGNSWKGIASGMEQQGGVSRARVCHGVNIMGFSPGTYLSWKGTGRLWCLGCSAELWLWWR